MVINNLHCCDHHSCLYTLPHHHNLIFPGKLLSATQQAQSSLENTNSGALSPVTACPDEALLVLGLRVGGVRVVICSPRGIQDMAGARAS